MRRKTLRWVSLAALAVAAAVFVTGALGASGQKGALDGKKVGVIICTNQNPFCAAWANTVKSGLEKQGASVTVLTLGVRSRGRRAEHEPPDRGQARPDHLGARERIRDRAVVHPGEGGRHPDSRRDRPPVGRGSEARHRRGAHRRPVARTVRRDEPRRGHEEGRLHEGQRHRPHRHRQPEQRHRSHGGVQGVHEEVPAVQDRRRSRTRTGIRRRRRRSRSSCSRSTPRRAASRAPTAWPTTWRSGSSRARSRPACTIGVAKKGLSSPAATASPSASTRSRRASEYGTGTQAPQVEAALAVKVAAADPERRTPSRRCRTSRRSASPRRTSPSSRRSAPSSGVRPPTR